MVNTPRQAQDKFIIRLPDGMRDKIEALAKASKRTMTGEIVDRLERTFREDELGGATAGGATLSDIEARLAELKSQLDQIFLDPCIDQMEYVKKRLSRIERRLGLTKL